ncbi:MAG: Modification methylase TaqI [Promethearchaeota archaeon]|nr:MAG: Modification methylase TaqI [Candidatus Lokiarchaeota archaeon]
MVEFNREKKKLDTPKDFGLVITPPKTAQYIVSKLGPYNENERILDPCVGPGIFIKSLLEVGVDRKNIVGYDLNPQYKKEYKRLGIHFEVKDYLLSFSPLFSNKFDVILGNPPYLNKASSYVRANRQKLKQIYGKINAHETYSMFIVSSIWRLKNKGRLGFIISDSFLTLKTHQKLRSFILNTCKIKEILLTPQNLFNNQNVSTNTVIIILEKSFGEKNASERLNNIMRIIPEVNNENEYWNPNKVNKIVQKKYHSLPFFFTDVEEAVIDLFEKAPKLEQYIKGYIGMHTHNNRKFIAAIEGTEIAKVFDKRNKKIDDTKKHYKIINMKQFKSGKWKPYLKRGGAEQYYRPIMEALDWREESIKIYDIPSNAPFEKEGLVISGVSSRLAARYMPKGCYWDSNKAIGFLIKRNTLSIEYMLGVLNSSLYNYLMNGLINNTNSIQLTGIHALPFILPDDTTKTEIEKRVKKIIEELKKDFAYDYTNHQKEIDIKIFELYQKKFNFSNYLKQKLDIHYSIYP